MGFGTRESSLHGLACIACGFECRGVVSPQKRGIKFSQINALKKVKTWFMYSRDCCIDVEVEKCLTRAKHLALSFMRFFL